MSDADKQTFDRLIAILSKYAGESGESEGAVEVLERKLWELNEAREDLALTNRRLSRACDILVCDYSFLDEGP